MTYQWNTPQEGAVITKRNEYEIHKLIDYVCSPHCGKEGVNLPPVMARKLLFSLCLHYTGRSKSDAMDFLADIIAELPEGTHFKLGLLIRFYTRGSAISFGSYFRKEHAVHPRVSKLCRGVGTLTDGAHGYVRIGGELDKVKIKTVVF